MENIRNIKTDIIPLLSPPLAFIQMDQSNRSITHRGPHLNYDTPARKTFSSHICAAH